MRMLDLLTAGLILAIGHHCYYSNPDGQPVDDKVSQKWAVSMVQRSLSLSNHASLLPSVLHTASMLGLSLAKSISASQDWTPPLELLRTLSVC